MSHSVRIPLLLFLAVAVLFGQASAPASGSATTLQTNGVNNSSQAALNLVNGTNCTVTNTSGSTVSFTCTGGAPAYATVSFSTTPTFTVTANTNIQDFQITLTGNVSSSTLTTTSATAGQHINFKICQDSMGSRTFVWPTNVVNPGTIPTAVSTCGKQVFVFDGTNAVAFGPMVSDGMTPGITTPTGFLTFPTGSGTLITSSGSYTGPSSQTQFCPAGVCSGRALGTAYQNTTGKTMWVSVWAYSTSTGGDIYLNAVTDANSTPTTTFDSGYAVSAFSQEPIAQVKLIVLPGNYYKVTATGSATLTLQGWGEWE